jgi:hypothetical protein
VVGSGGVIVVWDPESARACCLDRIVGDAKSKLVVDGIRLAVVDLGRGCCFVAAFDGVKSNRIGGEGVLVDLGAG